MTSPHKFSLERGSKKHLCPNCNKKTFVRYIDNENKQYLSDDVGVCDRVKKCGFEFSPKAFFLKGGKYNHQDQETSNKGKIQTSVLEPSYIDKSIFEQSLCGYQDNNFVKYLESSFDSKITSELVRRFRLGTSNKFGGGSVVFWQIDPLENARSGKVMQYSPTTGKRLKRDYNGELRSLTTWVHSALKLKDFNLEQCLFGLPQLKEENNKNKIIAIVESEKTAVLMTPIFPDFVWLSCGGLWGIKHELFKDLLGRKIVLYPDVGCIGEWTNKADELKRKGYKITVSEFCENRKKLGHLDDGDDVFDYFDKRRENGNLTPDGYPLIWDWLKIIDLMNGNKVETSGNDGKGGNLFPVSNPNEKQENES